MDDRGKQDKFISTEAVVIGENASRLSKIAFCLICVVPVMAAVLFGGVDNATWLLVSLMVGALTLTWLGESWRSGGFIVNTSPLQLPLVGLAIIGIIQIVQFGSVGLDGVRVVRSLSMDAFATKMFLTRLVVYLVFFAACLVFINTEARIRTLVILVIIFGATLAFFGIIQRLSDPDAIYGMRATPQAIPFGPFVNQHHFAAFMEMTGGVTLGMLFGQRTARNRKALLAFALVLMGIAIILTGSRGGLLGLVSVASFALISSYTGGKNEARELSRGPRVALALSAIALVLLTLGVVVYIGGGDSLLRGVGAGQLGGDFSSGRLHFWSIALKIFFAHPLIGAGLDAFGVAFTRYDTWNGMFRVDQAHNDYLQILSEAGAVGIACLGAFVYLLIWKGRSVIRESTGFRREAAIGSLAGCFGILIHSFFDFPLRTPSNAFFFLALCTVATVHVTAEHHRRRRA
ncbi:MAG: O-antigen ligase family protein [Pyrinomonadaceae bacterium]|nr:O-antigen ligase family protein [Pyrinomonadaceae bacterium]